MAFLVFWVDHLAQNKLLGRTRLVKGILQHLSFFDSACDSD